MHDPRQPGWGHWPPHSIPPTGLNSESHGDGPLYLMLGRLISHMEHIREDVAWVKDQLREGAATFRAHDDRMDKIERAQRENRRFPLAAWLRAIATPREWIAAAVILYLAAKGIVAPEHLRDIASKLLGIG